MNTVTTRTDPRVALRTSRLLLGAYLALSVGTVIAVIALRHHADLVTDGVWTRSIIVAASAVLTTAFAVAAARGSRSALLRMRIVTGVMLAAVVVIVAIPGAFPSWFRIEQAACGMLLLAAVCAANGTRVRAAFPTG